MMMMMNLSEKVIHTSVRSSGGLSNIASQVALSLSFKQWNTNVSNAEH
jgi:hypothetical protein